MLRRIAPSSAALRRSVPRVLAAATLLVASCAVVDSVRSGIHSVSTWAESFSSGEGRVASGRQEGEWNFKYPDGQPRAQGAYVDDVQDGPWTYWYPSGDKEYEGSFANSRRTGVWRYWHPNGNPRAQGRFVEGREWGEWMFWNLRGERAQRGSFLHGQQTGTWTYWRDDGERSAEGLFRDGKRVGLWRFWDEKGVESREDYALDESVAWAHDVWPNGELRRDGFVASGRPDGLWTLRHRSGAARLIGGFESGLPNGHWAAFDPRGERLAEGFVEAGRPRGEWIVVDSGGRHTWDASASMPPPPFRGEWSDDEFARNTALDNALATWISEAAAPLPKAALAPIEAPAVAKVEAPKPEQVAAVVAEPDVPIHAQPWTQREMREFNDYVEAYTEKASAKSSALTSRYARRRTTSSSEAESTGGTPDRARNYLGKPLPLTLFLDTNGGEVDLKRLEGKRVVVVVLRGFGGGVCVYCTAQTAALCEAGALERFKQLGAELEVVFPGTRNGVEAFKRGYESLAPKERPPYGLLYQNDYLVSQLLDLEGNKVIPSTFILDEQGIVRFAYIGENIADRPPVATLIDELEKLGPRR